MRVLRNLDLAVELVLDEGIVILKKYEDLDFYLKKMAGGKIYEYKAMQKIKQIRKQTPATNVLGKSKRNMNTAKDSTTLIKTANRGSSTSSMLSSDSDLEAEMGGGKSVRIKPDSDLIMQAKGLLIKSNDPKLRAQTGIAGANTIYRTDIRPTGEVLNINDLNEADDQTKQRQKHRVDTSHHSDWALNF